MYDDFTRDDRRLVNKLFRYILYKKKSMLTNKISENTILMYIYIIYMYNSIFYNNNNIVNNLCSALKVIGYYNNK